MSVPGGQLHTPEVAAKALAFYLPQYHPIPENDAWWGPGFTEWLNVTKARPLFPGHYQPHVPGELGYYDLRVPEVREAQAELARDHGISGFVYYHYWFKGKRLLERPFNEVLASGSPDFPFALCWANEEWTRNWDGQSGRVLMPQAYSDDDDIAHVRWLATAFSDPRYITIDGKPLFLVYRPKFLPEPRRTTERWRAEAQKLGFPDLYLVWVEGWGAPDGGPEAFGFDATVGFMPHHQERLFTPLESVRGHRVLDYAAAADAHLAQPEPSWRRFPSVMVGWDNTARRPRGATIFDGATPEAYGHWLERTVASIAEAREEERLLFVLAWNEWAEGNHLEPDQHYGRAFLETTRAVLLPGSAEDTSADLGSTLGDGAVHRDASSFNGTASMCARLLDELALDEHRAIVDLGSAPSLLGDSLNVLGRPWKPVSLPIGTRAGARDPGERIGEIVDSLDGLGDVGALVLLDHLHRIAEPQQLLASLSAWALDHDSPTLVVSVPNVAHFDRGLGLLCGAWHDPESSTREASSLHQFTHDTLRLLLERCGWCVVAGNDQEDVRSDAFDQDLEDSIPEEMIGALRVLAETYNPQWAIREFIWALEPVPVIVAPLTLSDAVAPQSEDVRALPDDRRHPVYDYLASVGLVASETNRRAVNLQRMRPRWKVALHRSIRATPARAAMYERLRKWPL